MAAKATPAQVNVDQYRNIIRVAAIRLFRVLILATPTTVCAQAVLPAQTLSAAAILMATAVPATTIQVGSGQSHATIASAISAASDGDTISILDAVHTEAGIVIDKCLTIQGQGATATILQAAESPGVASDVVFSVAVSQTVTFANLTIRYGHGFLGGGVYCDVGSSVTFNHCVVTQNDAMTSGGGVFSNAGANLVLTDTAVTNNTSLGIGGGVVISGVTNSQISRCAVSGNTAGLDGGGVYCIGNPAGTTASVVNTSISGNDAALSGGGIYFVTTSVLQMLSATVNAVTIVNNHCDQDNNGLGLGGGMAAALAAGSVNAKNSLIANNYRGSGTATSSDVSGSIASGDYNLIESTSGATVTGTTTHNITGQDPNLSSLGSFGGPTQCHLPLAGSPVIGAIPNATNGMGTAPLNVDQRGVGRSYGTGSDIGAVEANTYLTTTTPGSITATTASSGGNVLTDGGVSITARGVCWNTTGNPTISSSHTTNGSGTGSFSSSITGLSPGMTYYVRAYATNTVGTAYGSQVSFMTSAATPTVTTTSVSSITATSAASGGNVTASGGASVTARGVCWNTTGNPTISNSHTTNGGGTGSFTSSITSLSPGTTYYVRAYATNSVGTAYGTQVSFMTLATATAPTVTTANVSSIAATAAASGGNVTASGGASVTARGVCWNTSGNPTISNSHTTNGGGTGSFTSSITGLSPATIYYVRAYAANLVGTAYGAQVSFMTLATATVPTVTTASVSSITATTAASGGNVTASGATSVTARGVCWSATANPTISDSHTTDGGSTGSFTSSITSLSPGTTYYVRAYATNSVGTAYGSQVSFMTLAAVPTVTTSGVSSITATAATSGGNVTASGGASVTARGVCWNTTGNPTISNSHTTNGGGTGSFTSSLTGLPPGTTYFVRAYATNSIGTAYGNQVSLVTSATTPTVTTASVSSTTTTAATSGGNVTTSGGASVTARGVCWNTTANPTVSNSHTTNGGGTGSFTSSITSLSPGTTYYVRAYATNSVGTAYGGQAIFMTATPPPTGSSPSVPTLTVADVGSITASSALGGGNITSDGGASITARGVSWNTAGSPTINDEHTTDGGGTGSFTSDITGLSPGMTYYVRAYATNSAGTTYSDEISFTTATMTPTVTAVGVTSVTATGTSVDGMVTADGGAGLTARGVCWNTTGSPTLSDDHTTEGAGTGSFTSDITGLLPGTTYYVRVYATNADGTTYSDEISFTTPAALLTVTTADVTAITQTAASGGGEVAADGGDAITMRGVCWNTTGSPTLSDDYISDENGSGSFTISVTGLSPGTTYYVRAYATGSAGTVYGNEVSFMTQATAPVTPPTITDTAIDVVTDTTATITSDVSEDGGDDITSRGVCWNTTGHPTTSDNHIVDGSGAGTFTSTLTGLDPNTTYYVRTCVTASGETIYGDELSFATLPAAPDSTTPELQIEVTTRNAEAYVGDEITFDIEVQNVGTADAANVIVTIPLPEQADFVSTRLADMQPAELVVDPVISLGDEQAVYAFESLPAGGAAVIEFALRTRVSGALRLRAMAGQDGQSTDATAEADSTANVADRTVRIDRRHGMCGTGAGFGFIGTGLLFATLSLTRKWPHHSSSRGWQRANRRHACRGS